MPRKREINKWRQKMRKRIDKDLESYLVRSRLSVHPVTHTCILVSFYRLWPGLWPSIDCPQVSCLAGWPAHYLAIHSHI